jgi:hypothetical protein
MMQNRGTLIGGFLKDKGHHRRSCASRGDSDGNEGRRVTCCGVFTDLGSAAPEDVDIHESTAWLLPFKVLFFVRSDDLLSW